MMRPRVAGAHSGLAAVLLALCFPVVLAAQQASLQGIVASASTGGPLEDVLVELFANGLQAYRALTDRNGFYQIGGIDPGTYSLRGRLIGHVTHEQLVRLSAGAQLRVNVRLAQNAVALQGIVVSAPRGAAVRDMGRQVITPADIRLAPIPAGSGDLATYLQTLPGVSTTGDRGGQLFVRGGTPAENLALVDGIPIYHPFHILGFFSVFPEDLVSSADFYAGGFGVRYHDRTSSVLDVRLRDGNQKQGRVVASLSPFIGELLVEKPVKPGLSWLASVRRSLIEETSGALLGTTQPLTFDSELFKVTVAEGEDRRCSGLALRTSDRGRLDPEEQQSRIEWRNFLVGGRCVMQSSSFMRLLEINFSYTSADNAAVSRGSSRFRSSISRMQHDAHVTTMLGSIPVHTGYQAYVELLDYDLAELFSIQKGNGEVWAAGAYLEADVPVGSPIEVRPGVALSLAPHPALQPRLRASWEPFGRPSEKLQAAFGLYQQDVVGSSDMRDVGSVFTAWMLAPEETPLRAMHATLGWQQALSEGLRWSLEGYYKRLRHIPVPMWRGVVQFNTVMERADGVSYGVDARLEYRRPHFHGLIGYGYGWTEYRAAHADFGSWFGQSVQRYHPPHDRRHQLNLLASFDLAGFNASARWMLGSGLPFTQPLGFDEAFDYTRDLWDIRRLMGTTRLVLDKPFTGRMPSTHRLDLSLERRFDLSLGQLTLQAGAINAYGRRNMFYYDLYAGRRVDQLPLTPYVSVTLRSR